MMKTPPHVAHRLPQVQKVRRVRSSTTRTFGAISKRRAFEIALFDALFPFLKRGQKDRVDEFVACVEDIARQRLSSEQKFQYMPPEAVHRELMQEMDRSGGFERFLLLLTWYSPRYPLVERAVADMPMLSDATFASDIKKSVQKLLEADRHKSSQGPSLGIQGPSPLIHFIFRKFK
jgi:hypothetical protein